MRLLIGCPVFERAWILPAWGDALPPDAEYLFVAGPSTDGTTDWCRERGEVIEVEGGQAERRWNGDRYHVMASLRNRLLERVRELEPDAFWAIDSDIIAHPHAVANMTESLAMFDAVAGRCYLTPTGTLAPNYLNCVNGRLRRSDLTDGVHAVDVALANVMMSPAAYAVDYEWHAWSEDTGWSFAAQRQGLRLGYDARVCSHHVMSREQLGTVEIR